MAHLIETVRRLEAKGIGFRSLTEGVDTTTPGGTLVFHLFGALAQFERDLIGKRTSAGLRAAEARGRKGAEQPWSRRTSSSGLGRFSPPVSPCARRPPV